MPFELSAAHAAPLSVAVGVALTMVWAGFKVGAARKKFGVTYPTLYAVPGVAPEGISKEDASHFNCVQRAHQNMMEQWPQILTLLAVGSIFPDRAVYAAGCQTVRLAGLIAYNRGYCTGNPKKRSQGAFGYLGALGGLIIAAETIYRVATIE